MTKAHSVVFGCLWIFSSCIVANIALRRSSANEDLKLSLIFEERPDSRRGQRSTRPVANIEALVVADRTMLDFHGETHVKSYILAIMNMVSNIFRDPSIGRPINVAIVRLVIIEKQTRDSFTVSYSAKSTLQSFCLWQKRRNFADHRHPYHHDVALLFTRKDICGIGNFPCASIGMAMQGGMCSTSYSCSVVQDTGLNTAFTVAQMLGHNIGLLPLKRTSCNMFGSGSYIMSTSRLRAPYTNRFQWSSCSRSQLSRLLKQRTGRCLLDNVKRRKYNATLPGQLYNVDQQCRFIHGGNASFCKSSFVDVCKTLWCTRDAHKTGCITNRESAAEGTPCEKLGKKWCIGGRCVPRLSKPLPIDGRWGSWSNWTACSRSCGGGVQKTTRECNKPRPAFNGKSCIGERARHRLCNVKPCAINSLSFREKQCTSFNNKPYRGRLFRWKPFLSKDKECALVCQAERYRFYLTLSAHVDDGTLCRPGSNDRCIEGQCRKVGCNNRIGSGLKKDICGICGGNGSTCKLVNENFKKKHGIGYHAVTYIPSGSTSIRILEKKASRNILAIETISGENVLNSGYMLERPGSYHRLNTIVEYQRVGLVERIFIAGPISKDIKVMVLFQADSSLLSLQYAIQNDPNRPVQSGDRYIWKHDRNVWSPCSATCGRGIHTAQFKCLDILTSNLVGKGRCQKSHKPLLVKACENLRPCEKPKPKGVWTHGKWGTCSVTCGIGRKTRVVACTKAGSNEVINEKFCKGRKPKAVRECTREKCPKEFGFWFFGPWSGCSVTCGQGVKQRLVKCVNLKGVQLEASHCSKRKPPETVHCSVPCVKWVPGNWGECPNNCSEKQRRCVLCINMYTFTHSNECKDSDKPTVERTCPGLRCS